jgi:DNA-binding IclR family transcriptional regulator
VSEPRSGKYSVPVVQSTFRILEELSRAEALGVSELAERTRIPKSTVFRILNTLHDLGYLVRDSERTYMVSFALAQLGSNEGTSTGLRNLALPYMLDLRKQYGETVNLGVLNLDKVMYAEVVPSEFALRLQETRGATVLIHASALGKAILAFSPPGLVRTLIQGRKLELVTQNTICDTGEFMMELKRVRATGFAFDRGETSLLACCVAAPILSANGIAAAAISISGPASRFNPRKDSAVIASLLQACTEISEKLRSLAVVGVEERRSASGSAAARTTRASRRRAASNSTKLPQRLQVSR